MIYVWSFVKIAHNLVKYNFLKKKCKKIFSLLLLLLLLIKRKFSNKSHKASIKYGKLCEKYNTKFY